MKTKVFKLAQRQTYANGHNISVGLTGDVGYISIQDNNFYPNRDSRAIRRDMLFNKMMVPLMTREQLKELHVAIGEVLKHSK
jgi:hypothetical protein